MLADPYHVTRVQLAAAARLSFAVDPDRFGGEECLDLGAAVDHRRELQELAEPDRLTPNRHVTHDRQASWR